MNQTDRATLARYVTNIDGDVFALKNLPEEVAAVLFAYYSRSTGGLRDNLLKLISGGELDIEANPAAEAQGDGALLEDAKAKAKAFHEKWVVGYGHSSVAEHAVIKLALENVSILASKLIEDSRLASYTEKSTRYVAFDPTKAHYPRNVMESPVAGAYREGIERLMGAYERLMPVVLEKVKQRTPIGEKQTPRAYEAACRSTACDTLRYLLPTASHTRKCPHARKHDFETAFIASRRSERFRRSGQDRGSKTCAVSAQICGAIRISG
jgi:thymidylate synthase ThyX